MIDTLIIITLISAYPTDSCFEKIESHYYLDTTDPEYCYFMENNLTEKAYCEYLKKNLAKEIVTQNPCYY